MRALNDREKRTVRLGGLAVAVYLVLFFGVAGWKRLEAARTGYQQLVLEAQHLKVELQRYENRALQVDKLKKAFNLDPRKLSRTTLVADASAAIQKAATSGGVQLGPIRESPPRPSAKELASIQLEAQGQPRALLTLLDNLNTLGFPLIIDQVQISANPAQPGAVKLNLTVVILDYEQWKKEEPPHA